MFKFTMARSKYSTTVYLPTQCMHVYVYHANPEDPFYAFMGPIPDDNEGVTKVVEHLKDFDEAISGQQTQI